MLLKNVGDVCLYYYYVFFFNVWVVCVYMYSMYIQYSCVYTRALYIQIFAALKSSWKKAGVEPGNQEGPGCWDLWHVLVLLQMPRFVRGNGTN